MNVAAGAEIEVIFRVAVDRVLSSFRKNIQNLTFGAVFEYRGNWSGQLNSSSLLAAKQNQFSIRNLLADLSAIGHGIRNLS